MIQKKRKERPVLGNFPFTYEYRLQVRRCQVLDTSKCMILIMLFHRDDAAKKKCSRLSEMRVIVDEARNHEAAFEVDDARRPADT